MLRRQKTIYIVTALLVEPFTKENYDVASCMH